MEPNSGNFKFQSSNFKWWIFLFSGFFFLIYAIPLSGMAIFNSPDENANAVFTRFFAQQGSLQIPATYQGPGAEYLTPRSVIYRDGFYVPGSFIGLPLIYGTLVRMLQFSFFSSHFSVMEFFTPFFAVFGILAFFGILRRIFNERIAFFSLVLLALHPAFWYWASRGMMHNVLFVSLVLVGIYFLIPTTNYKLQTTNYFLAGLFLGLALLVRTFDMLLLAPVIFLLLWRKSLWSTVSFLVPVALAIIVLMNFNTLLYGSPFSFAYVPPSLPMDFSTATSTISHKLYAISSSLLPFGFHPRLALKNFLDYGVELFWWYSVPLGIGLWVLGTRWKKGVLSTKEKWYAGICMYVAVVFGIIYGSGQFFDHPDANAISLGNSYTRYWLPLYILMVPLAAYFFEAMRGKSPFYSPFVKGGSRGIYAILCVMLALNSYTVLFASDISLLSIRETLQGYQVRQEKVLSLTPPNAIIVAGKYDKFLWPQRNVVFSMNDPKLRTMLPVLIQARPLYYYSWNPERDSIILNQQLDAIGFAVVGGLPVVGKEVLLEIKKKPDVM